MRAELNVNGFYILVDTGKIKLWVNVVLTVSVAVNIIVCRGKRTAFLLKKGNRAVFKTDRTVYRK